MPSLDRSFNSFRVAGTNERLDSISPWAYPVTQVVDRVNLHNQQNEKEKRSRSFKTRGKEHQRDVKPDIIIQLTNEDLKKKSALVKHVCLNGHRIDWENSAILAIENDYKKRRFLESFYIRKIDFSFNDKINSLYSELFKFINFRPPAVAAALVCCHNFFFSFSFC